MNTMDFLSLSYEEKIEFMINNPQSLMLPDEVSPLAQYLANYEPLLPPVDSYDNTSSIDLISDMENICNLDLNTVCRVMKMLGYKLYIEKEYNPKWSMAYRPKD